MKVKTQSGITRPATGTYAYWPQARTQARTLNATLGRGHRAVKAKDGRSYGIVFRPSVAANRQRRCRSVA